MIVAGTRPEAIKITPIIWWLNYLGVDYVFVWSGQHYDYEMSRIFFEQLNLPEPGEYLDIGTQAQGVEHQVALLIQGITNVAKKKEPKLIYSLGDTNTTLATALTSVYLAKPFIHDEAGMRSFDNLMLEENNRRVADAVATFRLAPTKIAVLNLLYEGVPSFTIRLVGSTLVDVLLYVVLHKLLKEDVFGGYRILPSQYVLFTVHRRENLTERRLKNIASILTGVARRLSEYKIVFPIHPYTRKCLEELGLVKVLSSHDNILMTKPLGYLEFITLLKNARVVVTDSGGVQEEAFILAKRTVTLRNTTEWPETVVLGYNKLVSPDDVDKAVDTIAKSVELPELNPPQLSECPLGDGNAGRRVAKLLQLLSETGIERNVETMKTKGYPLPRLKVGSDHMALCFEKGLPIIQDELRYGFSSNVCVLRDDLADEEILEIIKVNWAKIDELLMRIEL
jgi:UDP-N-acetylglucosamine 2-epimerase (non-hydrolysing)